MDQLIDLLEKVVPLIAVSVAAKYVNQNSAHWTMWTGWIGRILGLVVSALDVFRKPKEYIDDIKP